VAEVQPRLVIFETFYLLAGSFVDESIGEVKPVLSFLTRLSYEYNCSVIISHHFHKAHEDKRHQDRVSGSNIFSRWYESAIFVERVGEEEENRIVMRTAHRDGGGVREQVRFIWDSADDDYLVEFIDPDDASEAVVDLVHDKTKLNMAWPNDASIEEAAACQSKPFFAEDLARAMSIPRSSTVTKELRAAGYTTELKTRRGSQRVLILPRSEARAKRRADAEG
jgi:hypothetical protein